MLHDKAIAELIGSDLSCSHEFNLRCETCRLRALCLPSALANDHMDALQEIIEHRRALAVGEHLYQQGDDFTSLYALITGSVKTYTSHKDGWVRVTGCHLPGEVFGFSGIDEEHYHSSAQVLEGSVVCEIPFGDLEDLCQTIPDLQLRLLQLMSRRLVEDHELAAQFLHKRPARKRIAAFLLGLSTRAARRGDSSTRMRLPMSRTDIGNYLGVTLETVCRELARLEKMDIIQLNKRELNIIDVEHLRAPICTTE